MNDNLKLFAKLKELNDLKEQNLIPTELYEQKEREVLERINSNNVQEMEIKKSLDNPGYIWVVGLCIVILVLALSLLVSHRN